MAEQVHAAHLEPSGVDGPQLETAWVVRRGRARIPSWLEADRSLHSEVEYICADRFAMEDFACNQATDHTFTPSSPGARLW